jgi:hypothetical protein
MIAGMIAVLLTLLSAPAQACGCGAYIPREGTANVAEERAVLRWDGTTEEIVMQFGVQGSSSEAAWIMPVPAPASVKLGDARIFDALQEWTKPRVQRRLDWTFLGAGQGDATGGVVPGGVSVLERQTVGLFDVATLAATDASALDGWLDSNGFQFPQGMDEALRPYVDQGWYYVAVRLAPDAGDAALGGELDPLWIAFPSTELIYPMRLSARARAGLGVYLYILADHRVEGIALPSSLHVQFADWIEPQALPAGSPIATLVDRRLFLTKIGGYISQPSRDITGDFAFRFAASDETYHQVVEEMVPVGSYFLFGLCVLVLFGVPLVLIAATVQRWWVHRRRWAA